MSELLVCADLLGRHFEVFRSVSQSCSCDLLARNINGDTHRVEVRTGNRTQSGTITTNRGGMNLNRWDILAVVLPDHSIVYDPPFPEPVK